MTESLVFISSDLKHDYHAVHYFTTKALSHLRDVRGLVIDNVLQWTDGCAAQYKSKGPFSDVSHAIVDFGVTIQRSFFGSRHGKGPSDGEAAVIKNRASTAVKNERVFITSAYEMFEFCQSNLSKQPKGEACPSEHHLRTIFWVGENEVIRDR